ncbi:MAG: CotH kinase family protein [Cyclobacteriaceae bacterium]
MTRFTLPFCILLISFGSHAQIQTPRPSTVFDDSNLGRIDITIAQSDLDYILDPNNQNSDEEFSARFTYKSNERNDLEEFVGFRLRGNTSRASAKKSFKVSFNSFEKGRDLDGFEKLNLNGEHNDPTMIRAKLAWDIMNSTGIPSSRANHVALYINDEFRGVYTNVEHIDEEFIEERFGNKDGNLFKCLYPADLNYKGADPEAYKEEFWGRQAYELKMNEDQDDYAGFANFMFVLNRTPKAQFETKIKEVFDVLSYLKALAVEMLIAHWDNYGVNQNNFYLYENPTDNKFYYIPYDLDNTLGVDFFGVDWADRDMYTWFNENEHRPLTERILEVPAFREEFTRIVDQLLKTQFSPEVLNPRIDEIKSMIQDAAEQDLYRTYDYGFTVDDFNSSFEDPLEDHRHVRYGLKGFIARRHAKALQQLDDVIYLSSPQDLPISVYPNPSTDWINIQLPLTGNEISITIYSIAGKMVFQNTFESNEIRFNPQLEKGAYILKTVNGSFQSTQKIIVK